MKKIKYVGKFEGEYLQVLKGSTSGIFYVSQNYLVALEPSKGSSWYVAVFHKTLRNRRRQPKLIVKRYLQNITKANNYIENLGFKGCVRDGARI